MTSNDPNDPNDPHDHFTVTSVHDDGVVRLVLRGEADLTIVDELTAALAGVELDGARMVELDVTDLDFVDVAAMRQLTLFAMEAHETGRDVRTRGARPMVAHLIHLFGVDDRLGLDQRQRRDVC